MRILFVSSGNSAYGISSIIKNQGESLKENGIDLTYYTIKGNGIKGYLKAVPHLKQYLKENNFNLIHAHYSLSAFVTTFAGAKPLIVSLMGSDVKAMPLYRFVIKFFHFFFWSKTIVKSEDMRKTLRASNVSVVPNGVDLNKFKYIDKSVALKETKWNISKKHILFAANPNRAEKNFTLAKQAFELLSEKDVELHFLENIPNEKMCFYYNSSNVVILTSNWEGSPNVIKEAMACEIPIVSTDVGDVGDVIGKTEGCYIAKHEPKDIAEKIEQAIKFGKRTNGRENISHLDDKVIAQQIISLYKLLI